MGLTEEYRDQVESIEESMDSSFSYQQALDLKRFLDNMLPFILMLLAFVLLFEFVLPVNRTVSQYVTWANWTVVGYFALRLVAEFKLSASKESFFKQHWFDFLLVVPAFSMLREIKAVKLLESAGIFSEEMFVSSAAVRNTGVAARLTKMARILKRSV